MTEWLRYKWWRFCKWARHLFAGRKRRKIRFLGQFVLADDEIIGYTDGRGRIHSINEW